MRQTPNRFSARQRLLADAGLVYAAAIWGSTFVVVKATLTWVHPVVLVGYRFTLAGIILFIYLRAAHRPTLGDLRRGLVLGFLLWLLYIPQTIGLGITTASNSGFITGMFVAFVPVFLRVVFRRSPTITEVVASGVSLAGLWILTGGLTRVNVGDGLTLIAAMAYALHLLYTDRYMKSGSDPLVISCQQFLFVGVVSLVVAGVIQGPFSIASSTGVWSLLFLALFPTLSAFVVQMTAQRVAAPIRVSLIFALEPVFAGVFAWTVGGEQLMWHSAVGGGLIFAALILSGIPSRRITNTGR